MSNISKRRKDGSRAKIKSMGDHKEFLKRITKTLYYGQLPTLPCLSLPVTEISCEVWSEWQRGRSVRRLHADAAAQVSRAACVSPAALVLALLYMERLRSARPDYLAHTPPADLFLVTLMVGNKFLQDDGEDEEVLCSEWAASGALELDQLKKLEMEFLSAIDWNVFVNEKSFERGLQWLERRVALKQAATRGFFTYGDLAAAAAADGGGPASAEALRALAAAALAYLAGLAALLAAALLVSAGWPRPADLVLLADLPPPAFLAPLTVSGFVPNSTLDSLATDTRPTVTLSAERVSTDRVECCARWQRHRASVARTDRPEAPVAKEWSSPDPWWSRVSRRVLEWLWRGPLGAGAGPLRRWLDEYAALFARELRPTSAERSARCHDYDDALRYPHRQKCLRQWLNLSKLGALVVSMSDR